MKIACLSDTHLHDERALPAWVEREIAGADSVFHCGDFVSLSAVRQLERLAPLVAVHGNMDEPLVKKRFPARISVSVGSIFVGLVHDPGPVFGREKRLFELFPECALVLFGHTHRPFLYDGGLRRLANPGAIARPYEGKPSLLVLTISGSELRTELIRP